MSLDLDIQLREFCDFMDDTQGPLTIDDILDRTGEVPVVPERGLAVRGLTVSRVWMAAAAAVIAFVIVGLALRFLPVLQKDVPPATDDTPTTTTSTAPPPQGAEAARGTLDTPMGTFNWWKLIGVDGELPDPGWPVKSESDYSLIVGPSGTGLEYWTSADGKAWLPAPSPGFEAASAWLQVRAGDYWLMTGEPASVWTSKDGATWAAVPLPAGYSQTPYGSLHELNGAVWLTSSVGEWSAGGVDNPLDVWRFEGTSWTSLDPGSIARGDVTMLNGWTGVEGEPAAAGGITVVPWDFDSLSVIDANDQGVVVTPPWGPLRDQAPEGMSPSVTVLGAGGQFLAYVTHYIPGTECAPTRPGCDPPPQPMIELWTSPDGLTWTGPTRPGFLEDDGGVSGMFRTDGNLVIGEVFDQFGPGQVWTSEDGINWSGTGIFGSSFSFVRLDSGAIYFGDAPQSEMFFSVDLRNWESVDVSALGAFGGGGSGRSMFASAGDTAFAMVVDEGSRRHAMWILELQE